MCHAYIRRSGVVLCLLLVSTVIAQAWEPSEGAPVINGLVASHVRTGQIITPSLGIPEWYTVWDAAGQRYLRLSSDLSANALHREVHYIPSVGANRNRYTLIPYELSGHTWHPVTLSSSQIFFQHGNSGSVVLFVQSTSHRLQTHDVAGSQDEFGWSSFVTHFHNYNLVPLDTYQDDDITEPHPWDDITMALYDLSSYLRNVRNPYSQPVNYQVNVTSPDGQTVSHTYELAPGQYFPPGQAFIFPDGSHVEIVAPSGVGAGPVYPDLGMAPSVIDLITAQHKEPPLTPSSYWGTFADLPPDVQIAILDALAGYTAPPPPDPSTVPDIEITEGQPLYPDPVAPDGLASDINALGQRFDAAGDAIVNQLILQSGNVQGSIASAVESLNIHQASRSQSLETSVNALSSDINAVGSAVSGLRNDLNQGVADIVDAVSAIEGNNLDIDTTFSGGDHSDMSTISDAALDAALSSMPDVPDTVRASGLISQLTSTLSGISDDYRAIFDGATTVLQSFGVQPDSLLIYDGFAVSLFGHEQVFERQEIPLNQPSLSYIVNLIRAAFAVVWYFLGAVAAFRLFVWSTQK